MSQTFTRAAVAALLFVAAGFTYAQGGSQAAQSEHKVRGLVSGLMQSSSGNANLRAAKVQELKTQLATHKSRIANARAELMAQRAQLEARTLPSEIGARQSQVEAEFDRRATQFDAAANAWLGDPSDANLQKLDTFLKQYAGAGASLPALPKVLPWGAKPQLRLPAETRTALFRTLARDQRVHLAQAGPLTTVGGVRFTTLPEAGVAPQDADLAESPEVRLSPAIRAKAEVLGHNPVNILNWVRANVQFVPGWGAVQDADATLRTLRGNAVDIASLTIAMLRASGIPARYQFGTVDVPLSVAGNWLGGVSRPEAILGLLQQGGIASRGLEAGGLIKTIRMEHAWALAYVNWAPSRGARAGGSALVPPQHPNPNAHLNAWVPLDGAFKQHRLAAGADFSEVAPFNAAGVFDTAKQGATCSALSARQLNHAGLAAHYAQFKALANQHLGNGDPLVGTVLGGSVIEAANQPLLAGTLAVPTVVANVATTQVTPALRWQMQLTLHQGTQQVLAFERDLPQLDGQTVSLHFVAETPADADMLAALLRPQSGGDSLTGLPARIAAYLVRLQAQLRVNGQTVAQGGSFTLGQPLVLRSLQQDPHGASVAADSVIVAGETHVWAVQGYAQAASDASAAAQRLVALRQSLLAPALPTGESQATELLSGVAKAYQSILDARARLYQRVAGVVEARQPSVARASSRLAAQEVFGLVTHVEAAGVGLHIDRLESAVGSRTASNAVGYDRQSLERASTAAHHVLDRLFGPGTQSALSGLAAAAQSQTVWRVDAATLAEVLAAVDPEASSSRQQVGHAAASGMQALLPQSAVDLGGLPMDPLVVLDAASGTSAYTTSSRGAPVVRLTAQRSGLAGWLGLADAGASKALLAAPLEAAVGQLNTAQALSGDIDAVRWQAFAGQADVVDALYASRIGAVASTADACDWLVSIMASQLGVGLPAGALANQPPVIVSAPVATAVAGSPYSYVVQATDADGETLAYALGSAPTGMTIGNAGAVHWAEPVAGEYPVTVRVSDGKAVAEQSWQLRVSAPGPLSLQLALSPGIANSGETVTLVAAASSANGVITRSASIAGVPLALDPQGVATFAAPAAGAHPIVVTASDGRSSVTREVILTVRDPSHTQAPQAEISEPALGAELRGTVAIRGSATDARLAYYQLLLRRAGDPDTAWQEIGRGLSPVTAGELGQLDTSRYASGAWQIGLRVVDVNGSQSNASVTLEFVGNLKLGQFRLSFADIRAEAPGFPLLLTRTYDSTKKDVPGDFGFGWSASAQDLSVRKNMVFGLAWRADIVQGFQNCLKPTGKRRISITLPDGGLYRFDARNEPECATGVPPVNIVFTPVAAPTGGAGGRSARTAQLQVVMDASVLAQGGQLIDGASGEPWNPREFVLTTEEGFKYQLKEGVGVLAVTDPYGNTVSYGAAGYQHSANLAVTLTRDAQGRITRATDPAGQSLTYSYNAQGELESVTDRAGQVTRFGYATVAGTHGAAASGNADQQHLLASITDPRGQQVMANQFDSLGRLTATTDALGQAATQQFDVANNTQTVTDRRGNRTVHTFDADGNITRSVNALGQATSYTYDANGNETSVTNALGHKTERTFDAATGKQLNETNPLGHTTQTAYPAAGFDWQRTNPVSSTDARGNTTTFAYLQGQELQPGAIPRYIDEPLGRRTGVNIDLKGQLINLELPGEALSYGNDSQGRRTSEKNALGEEVTYGFDANGNETSRTVRRTVNGVVVQETTSRQFDSENRLVSETDARGGKRTLTYNAAGKLQTQIDSLGRTTRYTYDANARLVRTDYPDGTNEQIGYDAEGNDTSRTDRQGRVTRMEYDPLNRLTRTVHPDGSSEQTDYDAAGRVERTSDRKGKATTYEYDDAGRQTASVDATGRRTEQTFDENGNRTSVTVAGLTTRFDHDALNRLVLTTWPDGSTHSIAYRPDNRKQSETDARGVTTTYGYDLAGRLVSVSQSGVAGSTTYSYDETGLKVTQVDALQRTTRWTQDANGQPTSRELPDGSKESSSYDLAGNRLSKSTFAGESFTFGYDLRSLLKSVIVPPGAGGNSAVVGSSIVFDYSASGQVKSQQESGATTLGGTQSYEYDASDRLIRLTNPIGSIAYGLDAAGNVVERSVAGAGTVRYGYDDVGRMSKVTAADGKQARYTYDAAGRLSSVERDLNPRDGQAQVLVTYNRYDSADRLIAIAEVRRIGTGETLLAGQALTRSVGRTIGRIETYRVGSSYDSATGQFSGTPAKTQAFEYDGNARLTREARKQAGATTDTLYEYNAVGNRTKKTVTTAAGAEITTYSYDSADRLTQESVSLAAGGTRATNYGWDGNGNLALKTEPDKVTLYRFDPQNRLIDIRTGATQTEAMAAEPGIRYSYDAQGNRVRKTTAQGTTGYLIDGSYAYAQVAREAKGSDSADYVRGLQLVRQSGSGGQHLFPLHGHWGPSLGAVDADGNLVEQVDADAFGNLDQATGPMQTHLYTGEYWDQDSQLVYLRARWYDPKIGRFISPDPFEGRQEDPRSLNSFAYAHSDPVHGHDPSGQTTLGETNATANVQGTLTTVGQQSLQTQVRKAMLGNPKQGDFGIIGNLILDEMLGAVGDVLGDPAFAKKSGQQQGTQAHKLLKQRIILLNQWIKGIPLAKGIEVEAELFLLPGPGGAGGVPSTPGVKGALGLDVVVTYRGKKFVAFDLKMGSSNISNDKYFTYQRRFGARLFLIKFK
ncbi:MAG: hypothetical protein HY854_19775 [Burkholderiales bacterium]|nr:hypothetical protein [Burkholderiales bacterium]